MIEFLRAALKDSGGAMRATITVAGAGRSSDGTVAAIDEVGVIFLDKAKQAVAYPWSSIDRLALLEG